MSMPSHYPEPPTHISDAQGPRIGSPGNRSAFGLQQRQQPQPHTHPRHGESTSTEPEDRQVDLEIKRPRACEPCRQLKVRCDSDPGNPDGPCKRCAKARRQCIVTAPTRKRQKKTDSRVTELERKIDALTATLQASNQGPPFPIAGDANTHKYTETSASTEQRQSPRRWFREDTHLAGAGNKRHHDGFLVSQYPRPNSPSAEQIHKQPASRHWRGPFAGETTPEANPKARNDFIDIIDRGLIDIDTAQMSFHRYVNQMADEMPVVVFPPGTTMGDVRRDKPALFLAIIAVSVASFKKDLQMPLINECYQLIADNVVVKGRKSLELVQALLITAIWYIPPDNLDELKFYQLIHMAIVLAMELGLNRRSNGDLRPLSRIREIIAKTPVTQELDLNGPEARRTWLGCYFIGIQVATALRRMQLVRWQPYMDESLQILESHPDALPSDRKLIWWAKLGWIMEQAGIQLTPDDTQSVVSFTDSKVRYTIKAFANQLVQYRRDIPEDFWTVPLSHTYYALNLFVHENAMGIDCRDSMLPYTPANEDLSGNTIMAPLIDALTSCIKSIHQALDVISSVDVERFTCLPTLTVARTAYPIVSLIKIYSLLTAPESRIGQVIDMQSLKVEYYLDKVINHYRAAAALDAGRVATKFGNIIMMLRNWFVKKKENGPELREIFGTEMRSDTPGERKSVKEGTNPLHVLSELAMEDPARRPSESNLSHRPHSGQGNIYRSPNPNYPDPTRNPAPRAPSQDSGPTKYGMAEQHRMGSMASTRSDPTSGPPASSWSSTSYSPQVPVSGVNDTNMGNRTYYPPFQSTTGASQAYGMSNVGTTQYPPMSNVGNMPLEQSMGMVPEGPFDPDNLTALGNIMDEGLFSFPFAFDGNFQF
ncbi:hypothetical protein N7478_008925 [Penicillium angulare]|uniref:uncharacterized protein n=1 Tax=Penicillium angulare TaxID=116970 RepID=UPI002541D47F|nr:uncharacterized protein N7478_008925 [Penicillium angulare]KAJ5273800.1 hypothetical protein N7478_008925 [Penicillium angulare]